MIWRPSREPSPFEPQERFNGLSRVEFDTLGRYNAERGRGIMHTPEWQARMAELQARFDTAEPNPIFGPALYGCPLCDEPPPHGHSLGVILPGEARTLPARNGHDPAGTGHDGTIP